jgi:anti-sigma-K factor RskA
MKPTENLIKKFEVETNPQKDNAILGELLQAQANSKRARQSAVSANIWRIAQFAIAAVVVVSLSCWLTMSNIGEPEQQDANRQVVAAKSQTPDELMSVVSLNRAFRNGGIKAMEKQLDKAEKKIKPELRLTIDQLICELEDCEEI